ncbi:transcriptional regulator [Nocardiopsis ansamitocini]|uniref:Transcriptional regulator n=2 Tax=Nocardiopsis ansamitocini TaxID=1670832 RepID=A0A9W6P914_9ACTN|nr:transcriptional regulator [Nocardiopsis ansamitocini]
MAGPERSGRALRHDYEAAFGEARVQPGTRSLVSASWRRSLQARVDPETADPPLVYDRDELCDVRSNHPLAAVMATLRRTLANVVDDSAQLLIVTDADSRILWCEGSSQVRSEADDVLLTEGAQWSEDVIGTNAMGTALFMRSPVQIYSAEHLVRTYHDWTCAASPITDPDSGHVLGTIDVSGRHSGVHPAMVRLVSAAAELAEHELRLRVRADDDRLREQCLEDLHRLGAQPGALLSRSGRIVAGHRRADYPGALPERVDTTAGSGHVDLGNGLRGTLEPLARGWLLRLPARHTRPVPAPRTGRTSPGPKLSLRFLGPGTPDVRLGGRLLRVSPRHAEILALLAMAPAGRTAEQLALGLYGEDGNPTTVRVEVHRLRSQLATDVLLTRPYRLAERPDSDFLQVRQALNRGDVHAALAKYRGEFLGRSEAPEVRVFRDELAATLRTGVLELGDAEALWHLAQTDLGRDDTEVLETLVAVLPRTSPRRVGAAGRLDALRAFDRR